MQEVVADLGKYGLGDAQYKALQAELDILVAQEYLALLQKMRENLYDVLAAMNSEILRFREAVNEAGASMSGEVGRFREVVDRAAADGSMTSRALVRWTKVLAIISGVLMLATVALVYATFRAGS